jgi:hypothetical protein
MNNRFKFILLISVLLGSFVLSGQAQDITTGLVAYYQFEETTSNNGDPVADAVGTHTGAIVGSGLSHNVTGKIGNAFNFDGTSHISLTATTSDITNYSEFTLSAWVYPTTLSSSKTIISKINSGRDFDFKFYGTTLQVHHYNVAYRNCNATTASSVNQWIHVLATWKNNEWKVYYNGILESTCNFSSYPILWNSAQMYIGSLGTSEWFIGKIDEIRVYNRALTAIDVTALYNYSGGGSTPALSVNNISVNENSGTATFTISMNQTSSQIVSGNYATSNGSATSGSDYTAKSGSFSIPIGQTSTPVSVTILDDASIESPETFNLTISNPANATIADATGVCTITDNDVPGLSCTTTINTFPYFEGFETNPNTWENVTGDNTDWTRQSGGTSSSGTGPSSAQQGSYYYYVESSGQYPSKTAILNGPCFDLSGQSFTEFSFYYHMYGAAMGTLKLEASTDGTNWNQLWSLSGDQGNAWYQETVNLSSYLGNTVKLRFYGTTGSGYTSDMAIDSLYLTVSSPAEETFWEQNGTNIYATNGGNVGIGTTNPGEKLTVNGTVHAKEVIINNNIPVPDYVFAQGYNLLSIPQLKQYIEQNNHLPEFPPASEMEANGINISEINLNLLKRIEELTLYIIEQEKQIQEIENQFKSIDK